MNLDNFLQSTNLESAFNARKLLYENKEIFHELSNDELDENEEYKDLNESIVKGQTLLKETILEYNRLTLDHQKIKDYIKTTKDSHHDLDQRLNQIKDICISNELEIEDLHDVTDTISYLMLNLTETIEKKFNDKTKKLDESIVKSKSILKSMSKAFGVLKNSSLSYTCPVCLTNQVDVYLDTCGHATCTKCIPRDNKCYFCRSRFNKAKNLYFLS